MASSTYQQQQVGVPAKLPLPLDYTVRKHVFSLSGGDFTVEDAHGNLAFKVRGGSSSYFTGSATKQKQLFVLDASGNPLLSLYQKPGGFDWECCRRNWFGCEELVFRARKRQQASKWVKELEIYLGLESLDPKRCYCTGMSSTPWDMLVKGSPFARSCTIYKGNNILAQYLCAVQCIAPAREKSPMAA
ncbi:protein LURP-one-related 15-like isoform X2 [Nymphaea colorata]|uniref:protein LURP-one-related 15-like isoform X2 n=1 Tax=Nymphaea colorata TaxID=210225 RepID=UPI00129D36E5|nr:protein LURP-one-related 15-like isoform X2 [Nymphaea colorata]